MAKANAKRLREQQYRDNQGAPIYQLNPYTNVDKLLAAIDKFIASDQANTTICI